MAKGKGKKKAARHQPSSDVLPIKDRLQQTAASYDPSPKSATNTQFLSSPAVVIDENASRTSCTGVSTTATGSQAETVASPSPAGVKENARSDWFSTLSSDWNSATINKENNYNRIADPRDTSVQHTSSNPRFTFPLSKSLISGESSKPANEAGQKRDSVISATWEEAKVGTTPQCHLRQTSQPGRWSRWLRLYNWWPCRIYRWIRMCIVAIFRGFQSSRWLDFIVTASLFLTCSYVAYYTLDCVLTGLIKGVNAQHLIEAANCSVVYVTIPGPIITVSLIAASPTDPARGTYYYSVINGTTQWLNSVVPPNRSSAVFTPTSSLALGSSSSTPSMLVPTIPHSGSFPTSSVPIPPEMSTIITTTLTSGAVIMVSTLTLRSSSVAITNSYPSSTLSLPAAPIETNTSFLEISGSPSRSDTSPPTLSTTPADSTASSLSGTTAIFTSTTVGPSKTSMSSSELLGSHSSLYSTTVSHPLAETTVGDPFTASSTVVMVTNILPGGPATVFTSTILASIDTSQSVSPLVPGFSTIPSGAVSTTTSGRLTRTIDTLLPPGNTGSASGPTESSLSNMVSTPAMASSSSNIQSTTIASVSTNSQNPSTAIVSLPSQISTSSTLPVDMDTSSAGMSPTTASDITSTHAFSSVVISSGGSSPIIASSTSASFGGDFTISLPGPTSGSSGANLATTGTRSSSGLTTTPTMMESLASTSRSMVTSSPSAAPIVTSMTRSPSGTLSGILSDPFSGTVPVGSGSSSTATRPSSFASVSSRSSEVLITSSADNTFFSVSSIALTTASSMTTSARTSDSDNAGSSSLLPPRTSTVVILLPSLTSSSPLADASITGTTTVVSSSIFTTSRGTSSASNLPSVSTSITHPSLTTTPAGLTTLSSSMSVLSSQSSAFLTSSLSFSRSSSWSDSGAVSSASSSSFSFSTTGGLPPILGPASTVFLNTTATNMSSTMSSTWLSFSTALNVSSSGSSAVMLSTTMASSFVPVPPTNSSLNSSSFSSTSVSSILQTSSVVLTTTPVMVTSMSSPGSNTSSALQLRALMTKIVSYGDASIVFVFPTPTIMTTQSYWTGTYPTVTGPEPSELQTLSLTTRSIRQTPLSEIPSFELFTTPSRFTTVTSAGARAQAMAKETDQVFPPEPTRCGESGNFTLSFDDTSVGSDGHDVVVVNGMKNPYHHLFYANGYTYVPDKWEPYPAISQPNVAMFLPLTGRLLPNTPFAGTLLPGEIGAGPRASVTAYWFNAYSGFFGCALSGLTPCTLRISGYRYDATLKEEVLVVEQNATLPACWGYINCRLTQVVFNEQFRALSGIQFNAYTYGLGIPQVHVMDELEFGWFNDTCAAGIWRIGHL